MLSKKITYIAYVQKRPMNSLLTRKEATRIALGKKALLCYLLGEMTFFLNDYLRNHYSHGTFTM